MPSRAQPAPSPSDEICLPRLNAERALEALAGCPRLVELDELRLRYNNLVATHETLNESVRGVEAKQSFAEGRAKELRDQLRAARLEKVSLIEERAALAIELRRRWPWYIWTIIGMVIGSGTTGAAVVAGKKRRATP